MPWVLLVSSALALACAPPSVAPPIKQHIVKKNSPAPARVDLPSMLKLESKLPPEFHEDGNMQIAGLVARRPKYMDKTLSVKGYLVQKVECPKEAKFCSIPHVVLADTPDGDGEIMPIFGLNEDHIKNLEQGAIYQVTGTYTRKSEGGQIRSKGLIIQEKVIDPKDPELDLSKPIKRRRKRKRNK
jgi:hypothetical protein